MKKNSNIAGATATHHTQKADDRIYIYTTELCEVKCRTKCEKNAMFDFERLSPADYRTEFSLTMDYVQFLKILQ